MMRCPTCGGATLTLETRQRMTGVYRRRACARCGARFSTIERVAPEPQPPAPCKNNVKCVGIDMPA